MLDLRKLRMLAELDRRGTITAVAGALQLTAPGVSMQLAALEREVGLQLTERVGRNVILTPSGRTLASHAHSIIAGVADAEQQLGALRDSRAGSFRLAAFPSAARAIVAPVWAALKVEGDIRISLTELEPHDSIPRLAAGELDLAVTHSYSNLPNALPTSLLSQTLVVEPVWLALREDDPLASPGHNAVDLASLSARDWIVPGADTSCSEMIRRATGAAGFVPSVVAEATDFAVQLALVAAGVGVALVPEITVQAMPAGVILVPLEASVERTISIVARRSLEADAGIIRLTRLLAAEAALAVRLGAARRSE